MSNLQDGNGRAIAGQSTNSGGFGFVTMLPFVSQDLMVAEEDLYFEVAVWWSVTNICDENGLGHGRCDTACGLYYGTSDMREGKFCPRHYYEMHFGEKRCYKLLDRTAEEFEADLTAKHERARQ